MNERKSRWEDQKSFFKSPKNDLYMIEISKQDHYLKIETRQNWTQHF
jgi:hypothetical protein